MSSKSKTNPAFSITQLLLASVSIKINLGLCITFFIHYLFVCCPNTTISELASFNALILIKLELVKLSVNDMFFLFSLFLLVNTRLLSIYLTNLTIMGLFLPLVGTPILCVRSISPGEISITTSPVSSF